MRKYLQLILFGVVLLGIVALVANQYLPATKVSARVVSSATKDDKVYSTRGPQRGSAGSPAEHLDWGKRPAGVEGGIKELRTRFNKDKGKVRLLMLLSPT